MPASGGTSQGDRPMVKRLIVPLIGALALIGRPAWADVAQIQFFGSQTNQSGLGAPQGGPVSDSGEPIVSVQSLFDEGIVGPFAISGGILDLKTPDATSVDLSFFPPVYINSYAAAGGSLALTGSLFGLPDDSTLLTATFAGGSTSAFVDPTVDLIAFSGQLRVTWISPVLLSNLGLRAAATHGDGSIVVTRFQSGDSLSTFTSVSVTPSPEAGTLILFGSGMVAVGAVIRSRTRRGAPRGKSVLRKVSTQPIMGRQVENSP